MRRRHKIIAISSFTTLQIVLIITLMFCGTTIAFLTDKASVVNKFTTGSINVDIDEPGVEPENVKWGPDTKKVQLTNPADSVESYVRCIIVPTITYNNGQASPITTGKISKPGNDGYVKYKDFQLKFSSSWESNWFYKDGYFYHRTALKPGASTDVLLQGVELINDTEENRKKYKNCKVEIQVMADAIQVDPQALKDAWDMEEVNGKIEPRAD